MSDHAAILLIEDDLEVQRTVRSGLARESIDVLVAATAAEGLETAAAKRLDLVLLDLGLPDQDGFELLQRLKSIPALENVPVLLLTAQGNLEDKIQAFDLGASDYITKPFDLPELRVRVRALLRSKRLQDQLTQSNRDLEAARVAAENATRAKSEFLARMSHEIRTPMNGVISMARLLSQTELSSEQSELLDTIQTSGDALLTIINDILDFSKIESGKLELESHPFELRGCIEDVLDLLATKASEKGLDLSCEIADNVPPVINGDSARLRQVLLNLVANAIKFTARGEVQIIIGAEPRPSKRSTTRTAHWRLQFAVRDTGIGIPPDKFALLFQSFSQVDSSTTRKFGGTGLGLAICKSIVELMGGKIWVESAAGKGSTFCFTIFAESSASASATASAQSPELAGMRLLVVDDNPTNRRILTLQSRKWGIHTEVAESGARALELLREGRAFDAAVLDMQMPDLDGVSLARSIRKEFPSQALPLILLTSVGVRADTPQEDIALFQSCLNKPIKPSQLSSILTKARKGAGASHSAAAKIHGALARDYPLNILLVDDNVINQKVATRLLQQMGYKPDLASNGAEAIEAAAHGRFDLILMDVQMPEMDGLEATRRIRALTLRPAPTIIAMTANALRGDRDRCLAAGMDDYLTKPIQPEAFHQTLRRWAEKIHNATAEGSFDTCFIAASEEGDQEVGGPPVDLLRLEQFTDGTAENLRELADLYLKETAEHLADLASAVASSDASAIRKLAHKTAGSSATCGMNRLSTLLRQIEQSAAGDQAFAIAALFQQVESEFAQIQQFMAEHLAAREERPVAAGA